MSKITTAHVVGLIMLNALMLFIERVPRMKGWRLYIAVMLLCALSVLSPIFVFLLLIPITMINLFWNTNRLRRLIGGNE